ncbi:hypothetical protein Pyn_07014 [Prunus yedoensis var. nudiflora]|uniref:Uncharacterized protein n=1 Tax=Prunus yedoensis var. nudiflora TaxID=2094558 RepID=A0A314U964_PRUYE|nr:hypothetical protein Pyn_07014 [Prunus yedoensis var. nudiflora]
MDKQPAIVEPSKDVIKAIPPQLNEVNLFFWENTNGLPSKLGVWRPTGLLLQLEKVIGLATFSVPSTEISSTSKPVTFMKALDRLVELSHIIWNQ